MLSKLSPFERVQCIGVSRIWDAVLLRTIGLAGIPEVCRWESGVLQTMGLTPRAYTRCTIKDESLHFLCRRGGAIVRELDLSMHLFWDLETALEMAQSLPNLRVLRVNPESEYDKSCDLDTLRTTLAFLPRLESLQISFQAQIGDTTNDGRSICACIESMPAGSRIFVSLDSCGPSAGDDAIILRMLADTRIKGIAVDTFEMLNPGLIIAALAANNWLERFELCGFSQTTRIIPTCIPQSLKHFSAILSRAGAEALCALIDGNCTIESLDIGTDYDDADDVMVILAGVINRTCISKLRIRFRGTNRGARAIGAALRGSMHLTDLSIFGEVTDDKCAISICIPALHHTGRLRSLTLEVGYLKDISVACIAVAVAASKSLHTLDLSETDGMGDHGAIALGVALGVNTSLRVLRITGERVTQYGATVLRDALRERSAACAVGINDMPNVSGAMIDEIGTRIEF